MDKPAEVRFYFDADVLGLAKVVASLRSDATFPGDEGAMVHKRQRPACPIANPTTDEVWIPEVAELGWLIVTRDSRIQDHPAEIEAVRWAGPAWWHCHRRSLHSVVVDRYNLSQTAFPD